MHNNTGNLLADFLIWARRPLHQGVAFCYAEGEGVCSDTPGRGSARRRGGADGEVYTLAIHPEDGMGQGQEEQSSLLDMRTADQLQPGTVER